MTTKIICRKCGGPHFTIKCGKEKIVNTKSEISDNKKNKIFIPNITRNQKKDYHMKTYKVKISDLPCDITEKEMTRLTYYWGDITKIKVCNYSDNSIVFIEFKYEDQADYFIKALHKTTFEYLIISVIKIEDEDIGQKSNNSKKIS
jgi:hypothetical protein